MRGKFPRDTFMAETNASNACICRSCGMLGATGLLLQDKDGAPEEIEQAGPVGVWDVLAQQLEIPVERMEH